MTTKTFFHTARLLTLLVALTATAATALAANIVAQEGAWCWFADPRALHYENAAQTINATYIGYIDVHGNVKATQYDWRTGRKTDVLVRSYFQPDDHNNPTFLVLPDERIMIFYTRHTDEPCIWYRVSLKPGDITALGDEKRLATQQNTTYPSPFILSDDPQHIYLCWRGINWHPTIARLTIPDAGGDCHFDYGPRQIVQSTGARPYAKYQSNGKDKIYVSYTTGHPDNEMPDWLYFNVIDINKGAGPILRDLNGEQLSVISNGAFSVAKTDAYANSYPATIVDRTAGVRNWVWQIALDKDERPVIAYPHIDDAKTTHTYWYARWNGTAWKNTMVQYGGHAFHQNWNRTELCYSGGMALDPDNINDLYLSVPTKGGAYDKDGVYELWRYTIGDDGQVAASEQLTRNSAKNNVRPYVIPGSKESPLRLVWMNGDYYYWIVKTDFPLGYPTAIHSDCQWQEQLTPEDSEQQAPRTDCICLSAGKTLSLAIAMNTSSYGGRLFTLGNMTYALDDDNYPVVTIGGKSFRSQNRLLTSDDWATMSTGTSGDNHPTKVATWVLTMTYDGQVLTTYRNGLVDQVIETTALEGGPASTEGSAHSLLGQKDFYGVASPLTVQSFVKAMQDDISAHLSEAAVGALSLPAATRTDLVLPATSLGQDVAWTSSNEAVISANGVLAPLTADADVVLTATVGTQSRQLTVKALARDITKNVRYQLPAPLDMTANTAAGFSTNKYGTAPEGLLQGLRSYTVLVSFNAKSLSGQPRLYDFGSASGNSLFLRANGLAAGIKLNGGTTTMVSSATTLQTGKDYRVAVSYDAATRATRIYIEGVEDASGTANQSEPYQLYDVAADKRNYIGRTQWWDNASEASKNVDFQGTVSSLTLYDVALTREEICRVQGIDYQEAQLPAAIENGGFEGTYTAMPGSGVSADRAIYVPQGWTVDYADRNANDITALKAGDLCFNQFFGSRAKAPDGGNHTYWVRQNWGTSTIALRQEVRLPAGTYRLTASLWKSGLGGDATVMVKTEGGATVSAAPLVNKEAWQQATLTFRSDGRHSTTVMLTAQHTSNGSEKIIGFDNVQALRLGDVNGDGLVNVVDLTMTIDHVQGRTPAGFSAAAADIDGDGTVAAADAAAIVSMMLE